MGRTSYSGYAVDADALLDGLAARGVVPAHERVVAEHVTYRYPDAHPAPPVSEVVVTGYVCGDGVDAVIVEVAGSSVRPDGKMFHITLSLAAGHRPVESNALIASMEPMVFAPLTVAVTAF